MSSLANDEDRTSHQLCLGLLTKIVQQTGTSVVMRQFVRRKSNSLVLYAVRT